MKNILTLIILFCSLNSYSMDESVFKDKYPDFRKYQLTLFSQLKTYFETVAISSVKIDGDKKIFKINKNGNNYKITARIQRDVSVNEIIERVSFYLDNGFNLYFEVTKRGNNLTPTSDDDLLTFHFKASESDNFYEIKMPLFNIRLTHESLDNGEVHDSLDIGFMNFSVNIETHYEEHKAILNYIYFSDMMPSPQVTLSVSAFETPDEWSAVNYRYFLSTTGSITPQLFFKGLGDGSRAFVAASDVFVNAIVASGFPKLL